MRLQTTAPREVDPSEGWVVIVGTLNVGEAENIVPDGAGLKLNVCNID